MSISIQTTQYVLPLVSDSTALKQVQSSLVLTTYLSPLSPSKALSIIRGNLVPSSLNRKHSYKHTVNPPKSLARNLYNEFRFSNLPLDLHIFAAI